MKSKSLFEKTIFSNKKSINIALIVMLIVNMGYSLFNLFNIFFNFTNNDNISLIKKIFCLYFLCLCLYMWYTENKECEKSFIFLYIIWNLFFMCIILYNIIHNKSYFLLCIYTSLCIFIYFFYFIKNLLLKYRRLKKKRV